MDNEHYDHQRALTTEKDMARRVGHLKNELPHVRVAYKDIVVLLQGLEGLLSEAKRKCDERLELSQQSVRNRHETLFCLKESCTEILRLKTEFSHARTRSKEFVQALINLEQVCVDTQGAILEITQSIGLN